MPDPSLTSLAQENQELRLRLQEARDTIRAIQEGEVEALVIATPGGQRVFTLEGADAGFRTLVEQMGEGAATVSEAGTLLFCNQRFADLARAPLSRVMGTPITHWISDGDRGAMQAMFDRRSPAWEGMETVFGNGDGVPVNLTVRYLPTESPPIYCATVSDLTRVHERQLEDLRRIEWMLRATPALDDSAVARSPARRHDRDLVARNRSRVIADAVGEPMLEAMVRDYHDLLDTAAAVYERNGDYAELFVSSRWCRFLNESRAAGADADHAADGPVFHCHTARWREAQAAIATTSAVDTPCECGLRIHALPIHDGQDVVGAVTLCYGDPPRDDAAIRRVAAAFGVAPDSLADCGDAYGSRPPFIVELAKRRIAASAVMIGEIVARKRAQAEREEVSRQLVHSQRMESVGRLAGGVAHDFNNMLGVILGETELALADAGADTRVRANLVAIQDAARRSADLTRQLLAFARRQSSIPRVLDLNDTVAGMLKMLRRLIGEDIELVWIPGAAVGSVEIDPAQLDQILANLAVNARDAIRGVGKVIVETRLERADRSAGHADMPEGEYAVIAMTDTGCGMPPTVLEHIFEPFFTTKPVGEGTGLGLATVYGIVEQHHGTIRVYSEVGRGTTFRIFLPHVERAASDHRVIAPAPPTRGHGETILVVEDESALLAMTQRILARLGYTVLAVAQPAEAIQLAANHDGTIHLLLTDVVMPAMNGRELAEQVRRLRPGMPCLYMSGYTADVIANRGVLETGFHLVEKPFSTTSLAAKVQEMLKGGAG